MLELRGKGLLAGIKLPDKIVVRDFVARLRDDHQMLTQGAGDNVLRLLPPLDHHRSRHRRGGRQARRGVRRDRRRDRQGTCDRVSQP